MEVLATRVVTEGEGDRNFIVDDATNNKRHLVFRCTGLPDTWETAGLIYRMVNLGDEVTPHWVIAEEANLRPHDDQVVIWSDDRPYRLKIRFVKYIKDFILDIFWLPYESSTTNSSTTMKAPIQLTQRLTKGSHGGQCPWDTWRFRPITNIDTNTDGYLSLNTDGSFDISAGIYWVEAHLNAFGLRQHLSRLNTLAGLQIISMNGWAYSSVSQHSKIEGQLALNTETTGWFEHYATGNRVASSVPEPFDFGVATGIADEVYISAKFWKIN